MSSDVLGHELAEIAEEIAEDLAPLSASIADVVCLAMLLAAATAWWKSGGALEARRWRRRARHLSCRQMWARWHRF